MKLLAAIFTAMMLLPISSAYAIPNMWISGGGQGTTVFKISTPNKIDFSLYCIDIPDERKILQHVIIVTLPNGKEVWSTDEKTEMTVVTDNSQYPIPYSLGWVNGDSEWLSFIDALSIADQFDVYIGDEKIAGFTPNIKNVKKTLGNLSECRKIQDTD